MADQDKPVSASDLATQLGIPLDALYKAVLSDFLTVGQAAKQLDRMPETVYYIARSWPRYLVGGDTDRPLRVLPRSEVEAYQLRTAGRKKKPGPKEEAA